MISAFQGMALLGWVLEVPGTFCKHARVLKKNTGLGGPFLSHHSLKPFQSSKPPCLDCSFAAPHLLHHWHLHYLFLQCGHWNFYGLFHHLAGTSIHSKRSFPKELRRFENESKLPKLQASDKTITVVTIKSTFSCWGSLVWEAPISIPCKLLSSSWCIFSFVHDLLSRVVQNSLWTQWTPWRGHQTKENLMIFWKSPKPVHTLPRPSPPAVPPVFALSSPPRGVQRKQRLVVTHFFVPKKTLKKVGLSPSRWGT